MSERPKNKPPSRRVSTGAPTQARTGRSSSRNVNAPRRSDPFPIVLGAIIGALVIGLLVVVYLISSGGATSTTANSNTSAGQPTAAAGVTDNTPPAGSNDLTTGGTTAPADAPAPRMTLEDFKKVYDDPAKRPIVLDVRAKEAYDAGHIEGAISFPEVDVDTRATELPKDKLIVAYCQ